MSTGPLRVGAAGRTITPPPGGRMAGYARRRSPATGTGDELRCRVVVFDDGDATLVLVVCDLLYPSLALTALVRERIGAALSVPADHVMVCATHTHCGPSDLASPEGAALRSAVADRVRDATLAAVSAAVPARLVTGARSVPGVSADRRGAAGPADEVATVLAACPAEGPGGPIATVVNFACHATVLDHDTAEYSADFPGAACATLESLCGGLGVYLQGCAGDVNPVCASHDPAEAGRVGRIIGAAGAQAALDGLGLVRGLHAINPSWEEELEASSRSGAGLARPDALRADRRTVGVTPAGPYDIAPASVSASARDRAAWRSMRWIQELRAQGNLFGCFDVPSEGTATLEVQRFHLAERLDLVALPGEPFLATARALRDGHDGVLLVAGYANQSAGYLPPSGAFARPGYEVGCSQYRPGAAEALTSAARALVRGRPA